MYLDRQRYTVFWPYTICRPNTKTKISRTRVHACTQAHGQTFFLDVSIRNSLRSNKLLIAALVHMITARCSWLSIWAKVGCRALLLLRNTTYVCVPGRTAVFHRQDMDANSTGILCTVYKQHRFIPPVFTAHLAASARFFKRLALQAVLDCLVRV